MRMKRTGRSCVSAITQTPPSGPPGPVTTPPMSSLSMATGAAFWACTEAGATKPRAAIPIAATPANRISRIVMSPPAVGDPVGNYAGAGVLTAAMVSGPGRRSKLLRSGHGGRNEFDAGAAGLGRPGHRAECINEKIHHGSDFRADVAPAWVDSRYVNLRQVIVEKKRNEPSFAYVFPNHELGLPDDPRACESGRTPCVAAIRLHRKDDLHDLCIALVVGEGPVLCKG